MNWQRRFNNLLPSALPPLHLTLPMRGGSPESSPRLDYRDPTANPGQCAATPAKQPSPPNAMICSRFLLLKTGLVTTEADFPGSSALSLLSMAAFERTLRCEIAVSREKRLDGTLNSIWFRTLSPSEMT